MEYISANKIFFIEPLYHKFNSIYKVKNIKVICLQNIFANDIYNEKYIFKYICKIKE